MKKKDDWVSYKLVILGALVLLNFFIIYDSFSSNPLLDMALVGHIPLLVIIFPSSFLTLVLSIIYYNSVKNSKTYLKNFYIKTFLAIAFFSSLLILAIFIFLLLLPVL